MSISHSSFGNISIFWKFCNTGVLKNQYIFNMHMQTVFIEETVKNCNVY